MKKILGFLVCVVSFGAVFGYQLTDVDQRIVDGFVEKIDELVQEKGDAFGEQVNALLLSLEVSTENERYKAIFREVNLQVFGAYDEPFGDQNIHTQMRVEDGDNVKVKYVGYFEDGEVFDTNIESVAKDHGIYQEARNYEPLSFEVGAKQMIEGFEQGVIGMRVGGGMKNLIIPPEEGYGEWTQDALVEVTRDQIVSQDYEVGDKIDGSYGEKIPVYDIQGDIVILDFNHPMAGKTTYFDVEVVEIIK